MNWTRSAVDREAWEQACVRLRSAEASLLGLWAEPGYAHMALMQSHTCEVVTLACEGNRFPSVGRLHPPAIRLERAIRDLVGLEAEGSPDTRPW
ncbi:MAG TPA: NADH-quinone oxidoreductase subunit C, partial [Burkholderiales bacterium]|nr:NADH-quinone oxidoreductase subunit C [Burkholderiales bacterium]